MKLSKNTKIWIHGLVASFVTGIGTFAVGLAIDIEPAKLIKLMAVTVAATVGAYLKSSPIPKILEDDDAAPSTKS